MSTSSSSSAYSYWNRLASATSSGFRSLTVLRLGAGGVGKTLKALPRQISEKRLDEGPVVLASTFRERGFRLKQRRANRIAQRVAHVLTGLGKGTVYAGLIPAQSDEIVTQYRQKPGIGQIRLVAEAYRARTPFSQCPLQRAQDIILRDFPSRAKLNKSTADGRKRYKRDIRRERQN
ncbi:hypothetical protein [Cupriavidus consociatus]|uniref:hypothetical protein n=1 Tax=Cupriavidus consociatus TaxID=2821357 RepID=UPI001AE795F8|nr:MULTISPECIES: hypothetical protein [unclassified Cupriavidus]MBP0625435.1 hypothetical protein [Cupriavidus sp. LEh25]MDK2662179.1 hypothetical protein [Cupriavidus sp. LEh21]